MDYRTDPRHLFDEVIATPDPFEFVRRAYRLVLRREASDDEIRWRGRLLKYVPFYTRDRFLRRLLQSPEAGLIGRATVTAGEALLQQGVDRDREARQAMTGLETWLQAAVAAAEVRLRQADERAAAAEERLTAAVNTAVVRLMDAVAAAGRENRAVGDHLNMLIDFQRFEQWSGFDQLRRLGSVTAERVGAALPVLARPPTPPTDRCRACGGPLSLKFRKKVLHDRYHGEYHECGDCHTLQIPDPYWLDEAYAAEAAPQPWNPDSNRFTRNFTMFRLLHALLDSGLGGPRKRVLDFGGGYGLYTQMLAASRVDAWGYDPYIPVPYFAPERTVADPLAGPQGAYDVVTAFEVFEHLTDAAAVGKLLEHAVAPNGAVLLTTGLYDPATHGPDWPYIAAMTGQHVTFWSRAGLGKFAARFGFKAVGFVAEGGLAATVISRRESGELGCVIAKAEERLADPQFLATITRPWVLAEAVPAGLKGAVDAVSPAGVS